MRQMWLKIILNSTLLGQVSTFFLGTLNLNMLMFMLVNFTFKVHLFKPGVLSIRICFKVVMHQKERTLPLYFKDRRFYAWIFLHVLRKA